MNNKLLANWELEFAPVKERRGRCKAEFEANSLAEPVTMIITVRLHETRIANLQKQSAVG
jgi:hypothetical protein